MSLSLQPSKNFCSNFGKLLTQYLTLDSEEAINKEDELAQATMNHFRPQLNELLRNKAKEEIQEFKMRHSKSNEGVGSVTRSGSDSNFDESTGSNFSTSFFESMRSYLEDCFQMIVNAIKSLCERIENIYNPNKTITLKISINFFIISLFLHLKTSKIKKQERCKKFN